MLYAATRRSEGFSQGQIRRHRGSVPGNRMVNRDRVEGHERLNRDYFATPYVYESFFRRKFRISRPLFRRIVNEVEQYNPYFIQRTDAVGVLDLSSLQKITNAYIILAYETMISICMYPKVLSLYETVISICLYPKVSSLYETVTYAICYVVTLSGSP